MDEERLRELEHWTLEDRKELTTSENVLLDAIAEACLEIRRARDTELSTHHELERVQDELTKDRRVMESIDLELADREEDARDKARAMLGERLKEHRKLSKEPRPPRPSVLSPGAT